MRARNKGKGVTVYPAKLSPAAKNTVCTALVLTVLLLFCVDFFRVSLYGSIVDKKSGFKMAFLLFNNGISKSEILSFVSVSALWEIQLASIIALLCLVFLAVLFVVFAVRAILKKSAMFKPAFVFATFVLALLIIQFFACFMLAKTVTSLFYDACCAGVTYNGGSFALVPTLLFAAFYVILYKINKTKPRKNA